VPRAPWLTRVAPCWLGLKGYLHAQNVAALPRGRLRGLCDARRGGKRAPPQAGRDAGRASIVVVAEGDFEPRSVGSYSLRAYAGTNPRFPYDIFLAGTVRPRDGTVEDVRFSDVDRDGSPEIIVVIRSAGTGGYLSADAFQLHGTVLTLLEAVSGLAKDADPIRALEAKLANRAEPRAAPDADKPRR
jgi:PliI/PliC-like inhibitor of I-type lysozyme